MPVVWSTIDFSTELDTYCARSTKSDIHNRPVNYTIYVLTILKYHRLHSTWDGDTHRPITYTMVPKVRLAQATNKHFQAMFLGFSLSSHSGSKRRWNTLSLRRERGASRTDSSTNKERVSLSKLLIESKCPKALDSTGKIFCSSLTEWSDYNLQPKTTNWPATFNQHHRQNLTTCSYHQFSVSPALERNEQQPSAGFQEKNGESRQKIWVWIKNIIFLHIYRQLVHYSSYYCTEQK